MKEDFNIQITSLGKNTINNTIFYTILYYYGLIYLYSYYFQFEYILWMNIDGNHLQKNY